MAGDGSRSPIYVGQMSSVDPSVSTQKKPLLPPRWVITTAWRIHRALYRWSGGRFGLRNASAKDYGLAQLTTTGRRTGEARSVMIGYFNEGDDIVTMAMNGWGAAEPAWWLNLQANPSATLVLPDNLTLEVTARAATDDERPALWERWRSYDKQLDGWAARRPSETAVVVLTPATSTPDTAAQEGPAAS